MSAGNPNSQKETAFLWSGISEVLATTASMGAYTTATTASMYSVPCCLRSGQSCTCSDFCCQWRGFLVGVQLLRCRGGAVCADHP